MTLTTFWAPAAITFLWCVWLLWPRYDGGNVGYSIVNAVPEWFSMGPLAAIWIVWGLMVFAL